MKRLNKLVVWVVLGLLLSVSSVAFAEVSLMGRWIWYHNGYQSILDVKESTGGGLLGDYYEGEVQSKVFVGDQRQIGQRFVMNFSGAFIRNLPPGTRWDGPKSWTADCVLKTADTFTCVIKGKSNFEPQFNIEAKRQK